MENTIEQIKPRKEGAHVFVTVGKKYVKLYFADWTEDTTTQEVQAWADTMIARLAGLKQKEDAKDAASLSVLTTSAFHDWLRDNYARDDIKPRLLELAFIYAEERAGV